jgi:hypothetical protein
VNDEKPWHVTFALNIDTSDAKPAVGTICSVFTSTDINLALIDPGSIHTGHDGAMHWLQLTSADPRFGMVQGSFMFYPKPTCHLPKGPVISLQMDFKTKKAASAGAAKLRDMVKLARKSEPTAAAIAAGSAPAPEPPPPPVPPAPVWPASIVEIEPQVRALNFAMPQDDCKGGTSKNQGACATYELSARNVFGDLTYPETFHQMRMVDGKLSSCDRDLLYIIQTVSINPT